MASLLNNYVFQGLGRLSVAWNSVNISDDIERGLPVSFNDAYVVAKNKKGNIIERMRGDATGGVMTLSLRGLDQSNMNVEVPSLRREREEKTIYYVTLLAVQLVDKQADNTFGGTQTFNDIVADDITADDIVADTLALNLGGWATSYASTAARDAALGADGAALHPYQNILAAGAFYNYNTDLGMWQIVSTGTAPAAATTTTLGTVELATQTEVTNGTNTGTVWPVVVQPAELKVVTDLIKADVFSQFAFGSWSDWDVTIAGTVTLTRDMFYNNLVIPSGQTLNPNGYRFFVKGTISGTGSITINGNNGGAGGNNIGDGGPGGAGGAALNQGTINFASAGGAGGDGGNGVATPSAAGTSKNPSLTNVNWVAGGAWGSGLAGAGVAAGAGGVSTRWDYYNQVFPMGLLHPATQGVVLNYLAGATSSGGTWWTGAGSRPSNAGWGGGGAGSNGGTVRCAVKIWNFTGVVSLVGGNGGGGGEGGFQGWGGGGGAGGNGGILLRIYHTLINDATITLTGGTPGTGGAWGGGSPSVLPGASGTAGNAGETISIVI
jgi:hypothetical protein